MLKHLQKTKKLYIRNFIFGVEDSLVSTVGLVSGIAIVGVPKQTILLTGIVLIFVEAFSMGAGSLISEHSVEEYSRGKHKATPAHFFGAVIMFISYFLSGFVPLLPYILLNTASAFWVSIICSLITLSLLGIINAKIFRIKMFSHAFEMFVIGGLAIGVGVGVGKLVDYIS